MWKWIFLTVFKIVLASIIVISFPICLVISCVNLVVIKIYYRYIIGKPFNILCGCDAFLQVHGKSYFTTNDCITMTIFVLHLSGCPNVCKWRRRVHEKWFNQPQHHTYMQMFSKFAHRIVKKHGYYIWEKDNNFSMEHHIRTLPVSYEDDTSLMRIICDLYHEPLSKDHSPWEIVLIGKNSQNTADFDMCDNCYAAVLRIHHSLADGSLILMMLAALSGSYQWFQDSFRFEEENMTKAPALLKSNKFLQYLASRKDGMKLTPQRIMLMTCNVIRAIFSSLCYSMNCLFDEEKNGLHGPPLVGRKMMAVTDSLDLKLFKDISKEFKCTINDIFMNCIYGAILAEDPTITKIKMYFMLGGVMPGTLGTQNTLSMISVDTNISETSPPNLRLKRLSKDLNSVMSSSVPLGLIIGLMLASNHLPSVLQGSLADILNGTFDATNLRGPPCQLEIDGDTITDASLISMNTGRTMGISFSFFSYHDSVRIGVLVDRAVARDDFTAKRLISATVNELDKLHQAFKISHPENGH